MGTYGTANGLAMFWDSATGEGKLLSLTAGEVEAAVIGAGLIWAGGKGVADSSGISHTEDASNYWQVKPGAGKFMTVVSNGGAGYVAIYAQEDDGIAVQGVITDGNLGVGVQGEANTYGTGVHGLSGEGVGVLGDVDASGGIGVLGRGYASGTYGIKGWALTSGAVGVLAQAALGATTALQVLGGVVDGGSERYTLMGDATTGTDGLNLQTANSLYVADSAISAPTNLSLTQAGDVVEVGFDQAAGTVDRYEVWSSLDGGTTYGLLGVIPSEDAAATMTVDDSTWRIVGTIYYRVYSVYRGKYSTALTGNVVTTDTLGDISGLTVTSGLDRFWVAYTLPDDERFSHVEIYVDANADSGSLSEGAATLCYSGPNNHYTYRIPDADIDLYHEFWISTVART